MLLTLNKWKIINFAFFIPNEFIAAAAEVKYELLPEFLCNLVLINVHFLHSVNNNIPNLPEAVVGNSLFFSVWQEVRFAF